MKTRGVSQARSIGAAIEELVTNLGIKKKLREQDVFEVWGKAVGDRIAKIATPTRIVRGTLFVHVKSGTWRNELNMRKEEIVSRLNELLAEELVKDIKFQ